MCVCLSLSTASLSVSCGSHFFIKSWYCHSPGVVFVVVICVVVVFCCAYFFIFFTVFFGMKVS